MGQELEVQRGWLTLIIVTLSIFTIVIDKTFMNVAISLLISDLHTNIGTIQIIIATYSLTMASLMLIGGRLQNILGRKRTFLTGAAIYWSLANIVRLIMNFKIGGVLFVIPVYVQDVLGANPLTTGLTLIPMSVTIFILSSAAGKLPTRIQPRYILAIGSLAAMTGSIYLSLIFDPYTTILDMVPSIFLLGVGMGIVFPHSANVLSQ